MQRDMKPQHTHIYSHTHIWRLTLPDRQKRLEAGEEFAYREQKLDLLVTFQTVRTELLQGFGVCSLWDQQGAAQPQNWATHFYKLFSCFSHFTSNSFLSYLSVPANMSHLHHPPPPLSVSMASFHPPPFLFYSKLLCILEPGIRRKTFPIWDEESACLHRCPEIAGLWV